MNNKDDMAIQLYKTKTINLKFSDINVCFVIKGLMVLLWLWYLMPLSTIFHSGQFSFNYETDIYITKF
jgi:hypothetical protein